MKNCVFSYSWLLARDEFLWSLRIFFISLLASANTEELSEKSGERGPSIALVKDNAIDMELLERREAEGRGLRLADLVSCSHIASDSDSLDLRKHAINSQL